MTFFDNHQSLAIIAQFAGREELSKVLIKTMVRKGTILLSQGDVSSYIYFVETGFLRIFHFSSDESSWFIQSGEVAVVAPGFFDQTPSEECIEVMEDSFVYKLSFMNFRTLMDKCLTMNKWTQMILSEQLHRKKVHIQLLTHKCPLHRYECFRKMNPGLAAKLSLKQIAAFIGVSYANLSHIRKRAA